MNTDHSISVIIPAYNRETYLAEAIESVLLQSQPPAEIIVVDDGSTDHTGEIARSFGEKVTCITQENQGAGAARNAGLERAGGSYVAFLDSDDLWVGQKLEIQAGYLRAHPGIDMVFCHMRPFLSPEINEANRPKFDARETAASNVGSLLARREAFARAGLFSTARDVPEFFPWFAQACDAGLAHHTLPEVLLLRRVHLTNMVHDPRFKLAYVRFLKQRLDDKRRSAR
jgi:glycosyltransferase involved in cell wall biosynthesis